MIHDYGLATLCGARDNQLAIEEDGHGFFTRALMEGLAGATDNDKDGIVERYELLPYVCSGVRKRSDGDQVADVWASSVHRVVCTGAREAAEPLSRVGAPSRAGPRSLFRQAGFMPRPESRSWPLDVSFAVGRVRSGMLENDARLSRAKQDRDAVAIHTRTPASGASVGERFPGASPVRGRPRGSPLTQVTSRGREPTGSVRAAVLRRG